MGGKFQFKMLVCEHKWNPEPWTKPRCFLCNAWKVKQGFKVGITKAKTIERVFTFCLVLVKKNHSGQDILKHILSTEHVK